MLKVETRGMLESFCLGELGCIKGTFLEKPVFFFFLI